MSDETRFLTVKELADFFGVKKNTIYKKIMKNEIPGIFRIGSKRSAIRFRKSEIEKWINKN